MKFSKHNIFSRIHDSNNYFLVNVLSGQADIIDQDKAQEILSGNYTETAEYISKGYLVNSEEEDKLFRDKYLTFIDERENDEIQLFFAPTYACNFACSYCYQDEYEVQQKGLTTEIIDAFFEYVGKEFADRRKYVTLFGGEPLLANPKHFEMIRYFIDRCNHENIELAVVTNGYTLAEYIPILQRAQLREIQVTLDGTQDMHDQRRPLKNKQGTFKAVVEGINLLLENSIPVNLRVVLDKENINYLPTLADFAIEMGWTKHPFFKTQLGRNYELHHCQLQNQKLFSRISLYEKIYKLVQSHPEILEFHRPAFSVTKFLADNGELPAPLFDACPGTKTEWAFDYTGNIFACTATVGKQGESLGTFYPAVTMKQEEIEEWQDRDILSISRCKDCALQLACGGGCAAVAKNQNGDLQSTDCRPIDNLIALGIAHYFDQ